MDIYISFRLIGSTSDTTQSIFQVTMLGTVSLSGCIFNFFLKKNLEDVSPFLGATETPVLDFWCSKYCTKKSDESADYTSEKARKSDPPWL